MVLTPAPNSRRPDVNSPEIQLRDNWTLRFRKASASRLNRKVSFLTLASCAFLLPGSLSVRSEAAPDGPNPVESSQPVSSPVSPSVSPALTEAAPKAPLSAKDSLSSTLSSSSLSLPYAKTSGPYTAASNSQSASLSSQLPSHSSSQQLSSPELRSDTSKVRRTQSGASDSLAHPASSLSSVTKLAPLPYSPADRSVAKTPILSVKSPLVAPATIRIRAIVSGQERQSQIAVTPKLTVGQALAAMGISLAALDRVVPDAAALARDGLTIRLTRVEAKLQKKRIAIPAELRYQPTTKIGAGAKQTLQEAKAGYYEVTERVWKKDGQESKREFVSKRLAVAPQHKIVALGVNSHLMPNAVRPHRRYASALPFRGGTPRDRMLPPADPRTFAPIKSLSVLATGYSAGRAGGALSNWTATGVRCTYGAVAVDPRLIPLGSKLYIEGYGYGFACDTGGAIKGHHIDLAFDSPRAAFRHGKTRTTVWILGR